VDRQEAEFLAQLRKRIQRPTPGFDTFFYKAIKDHILADGRITAEGAGWLRQMIYDDGTVDDHEMKLLRELKGEAKEAAPEFDELFRRGLKDHKPRQHTSGHGH
jgi:hypothetical protein